MFISVNTFLSQFLVIIRKCWWKGAWIRVLCGLEGVSKVNWPRERLWSQACHFDTAVFRTLPVFNFNPESLLLFIFSVSGLWSIVRENYGTGLWQNNATPHFLTLKGVYIPTPGIFEYVTLHLRMWLSEGSWDGDIILDYFNGASVITRIFLSEGGREGGESVPEWWDVRRTWLAITDFEDGMWPWAKECRWPLGTGKGKEMNSPQEPPDFSPMKLIWDLQNCKVNKSVLLYAAGLVTNCSSSKRKLVLGHW